MQASNDAERILRAIWLKAAGQPQGLELNCGTYSSAKHYQMRLYKLARPVRENPLTDPEFASAVERLSISVTKGSGMLKIQPVAVAGVLGNLAQQIGYDPRSEVQSEANEIEKNLARKLEGIQQAVKPNPYNTRG